jgi:hypothetical protein
LKSNPKTARCRNQQEIILSNYTQSTNFATKDALPSGDPLKIVKGTEINTEFVNIAVAVATKADLTSPTFTGSPVLPTGTTGVTQTSTDDSTKLATTAFVQDVAMAVKEALFPVGSIYVNATDDTNPGTLLGFGTWTAFGAGRVMVGLNGSDTLFDTLEETGGSKDATLPSHTHTATVTDPGHDHTFVVYNGAPFSGNNPWFANDFANPNVKTTSTATTGITVANSTEGSSGTNANLQPYITVAMWKRTA